ncbi:MAG: hypothetical protein PF638_13140 [Candidatus Delongbacteria bacterium]|jgi:ribulose 1,5-bisphosphate synthetase/thiazole synthase|nr:hypothetical protein [Candidatus Delongbacteria bacterium]
MLDYEIIKVDDLQEEINTIQYSDVVVVGGGARGFFCSCSCTDNDGIDAVTHA